MGEVGPYRLTQELGRGGMGVVYRAVDARSGREVALKLLHGLADPEDRLRFAREVELAAGLSHPHLLRVLDRGQERGQLYLVCELAARGSLGERLRAGPLPPLEAAELVARVARGLEVAHQAGVLHRDLKPDNVLLGAEGAPMLGDFGLARRVEGQTLTATGSVLGTPGYLSPEQARGERADVRSDVYGLGALLYAALSGRPPFRESSLLGTLAAVVERPPPPLELPSTLQGVLARCLAKDPAERYTSAAALAQALEAYAAEARSGGGSAWRGVALGGGLLAALAAVAWLVLGAASPARRAAGPSPSPSASAPPAASSWAGAEASDAPPPQGEAFPPRYLRLIDECTRRSVEDAQRLIEAGLRERPRDPALYLQRAQLAQRAGRVERCEGDLERACELAGEQAWVWAARAGIHFYLGAYEEALEHMEHALQFAPRVAAYWGMLGSLHALAGDKAKALEVWQRTLEIDPDHLYVFRERAALHLLQAGSLAEGVADAERHFELAPESDEAWRLLALARFHQQRLQEALALLDRAQAVRVTSFGHYLRARCLAAEEKWEEAIRDYQRAREAPSAPEGRRANPVQIERYLATSLLGAGRLEEALEACERALQLDPQNTITLLLRCSCFARLGRHGEAEQAARAVVAARPRGAKGYAYLARTLAAQDKSEEALEVWDEALARASPKLRVSYRIERAGLLVRRGDYAQACASLGELGEHPTLDPRVERLQERCAREWAERVAASLQADSSAKEGVLEARALARGYPQSHDARRVLAFALYRDGQLARALAEAERALSLEESAYALYVRGLCKLRLGRELESALRDLERALEDPGDLSARGVDRSDPETARARVLNRLGRHDEALAQLERVLRRDAERWRAQGLRASVLNNLGRHPEAQRAAEAALEGQPGLVEATFARGIALAGQGEDEQAQELFERLRGGAAARWWGRASLERGRCLARLGRRGEAREVLGQLVERQPRAAISVEARTLLRELEGQE